MPRWVWPWLLLLPTFLAIGAVAFWPILEGLRLSLTNTSLITRQSDFVGLENYTGLLSDARFWNAWGHTVWFTFASTLLETLIGLGMALVLYERFACRGLVRAAMLVPWAIPTVVSAKIWQWMLNDQFGVVNSLLQGAGFIDGPVAWLGGSDLAMVSIVMVDVWKTTPFVALLVLAALQTLPKEIYEAAKVDGIHPVKVFFQVTLPLIKPALVVAVIFRLLDAMRMFDLVYVMTGSSEETMTLSVYARQALVSFQDVGYGSAASTGLFLIIALLTVIYIMTLKPLGEKRQ